MPQNVRCHVLGGYGGACAGGCGGVLGEEAFDGVVAEAGAAAGGEQRVAAGAAAFGEPVADDGRGGGGERGRAVLAAFAVAGQVRPGAEEGVGDGEGGQLGDPQAGPEAGPGEGTVAAAGPGCEGGGRQRRPELLPG